MRTLVAALFLGALVLPACSSSSPEPDLVVQVRLKCERRTASQKIEQSGEACNTVHCTIGTPGDSFATKPTVADCVRAGGTAGAFAYDNRRLEIEVKTADGKTYAVEEAPDATIAVGDRWPPH